MNYESCLPKDSNLMSPSDHWKVPLSMPEDLMVTVICISTVFLKYQYLFQLYCVPFLLPQYSLAIEAPQFEITDLNVIFQPFCVLIRLC